MEYLFITPQEMTSTSILGGNVAVGKYMFCVANVQVNTIENLLGTELYDKIITDVTTTGLTGLYLELYNDYIKPITKNRSIAEYIEISSYMLTNGGLFKHTGENIEVVTKEEALFLSNKYNAYAQGIIKRFEKWICKNPLAEYKTSQDGVNAKKGMKLTAGWRF